MKKLLAIVLALVLVFLLIFVLACVVKFNMSTSETAVIYEKASKKMIAGYNAEIDSLIEEINTAESTVVPAAGCKAYYVSSSEGDNSNDGLSAQTPWETISKVNNTTFAEGDVVYFKRGDEWRTTTTLLVQNGVSYSAYGEGAKPVFNMSRDASKTSDWEETEWENIYKYTGKITNVGAIIFDKGRAWGIYVSGIVDKLQNDTAQYAGQRVDNGTVFNGLEFYAVEPHTEFAGPQDLKGNLEFYHDVDPSDRKIGGLYLYCRDGNPAEVFDSVELSFKKNGVGYKSNPARNIVFENIAIYGAGVHGISWHSVENVTVQYCTFKWIGGSVQAVAGDPTFKRNYNVRFGNAVESYGNSNSFTMHHNYASQVYDCCWTAQNAEPANMEDIHIYSNVAEFANTGTEVWLGDSKKDSSGNIIKESKLINLQVHDNYDRYIGYGFSHQRPSREYPASKADGYWIGAGGFFYGAYNRNFTCEGNDIYNNVYMFSGAAAHAVAAPEPDHFNFHDNTYIMEEGKQFAEICGNLGPYSKDHISYIVSWGIETGTDFYYTKPNPLGNMYELCVD